MGATQDGICYLPGSKELGTKFLKYHFLQDETHCSLKTSGGALHYTSVPAEVPTLVTRKRPLLVVAQVELAPDEDQEGFFSSIIPTAREKKLEMFECCVYCRAQSYCRRFGRER